MYPLSKAGLVASKNSIRSCAVLILAVAYLESCAAPSGAETAASTMSCCETGDHLVAEGGGVSNSGEALDALDALDLARSDEPVSEHGSDNKPRLEIATVSTGKGMTIPDVTLIDQNGDRVRFYTDLVKGRVVAMNFIFTTCTTICPPLTANFAKLQGLLGERSGRDVQMISVSVDPVTDTPERLQAWGEKFGAKPGWTFLTGEKHDIDMLLKAIRAFTPLKEDHSPFVLLGNDATGTWTRINGLGAPGKLLDAIDDLDGVSKATPPAAGVPVSDVEEKPASTGNPQAHEYFTDVELINQRGEKMRLYSDLMQDKVVVMGCFFTECSSVCPVLNQKFLAIQEAFGDELGKKLHLISLSVDAANDTPERLKEYAEKLRARDGWYFLTGEKENIDLALRKVGFYVESREGHSNLFMVGNDRTGLWKKAFGLAGESDIVGIVESVLRDDVQ